MKEFWVKVFSDKNGVPSSTRVLSAIVILDVLGVWTGLFSYRDWETDRKSTRLNSSHEIPSRMPSSA